MSEGGRTEPPGVVLVWSIRDGSGRVFGEVEAPSRRAAKSIAFRLWGRGSKLNLMPDREPAERPADWNGGTAVKRLADGEEDEGGSR